LNNYLPERRILAYCGNGIVGRNVYADVSQESIVGPLLWNIVYDGFSHALDSEKNIDAVTFADDLALVITMRKLQDIGDRVREAMKVVTEWSVHMGLHLTQEKAEVI
jgi:hypothetical protein